jgi:hypothetical protein
MNNFEKLFYKHLLSEFNTSGAFGASPEIGSHGGAVPGGSDWYGSDNAMMPSILGAEKKPASKKKKKKKNKKKILHQRRNLKNTL